MKALFRGVFAAAAVTAVWTVQAMAGTISGTVTFDGTAPKFNEIKMDADPICAVAHKDAVYPETLVLGEGKTVGNVFVYLKTPPAGDFKAPADPVVIDQKGCSYAPHVVGVMVGQPLKILNSDGTLHNVHGLSKDNGEFNVAMPKFRKEITKTFDKPESMFALKCDVHPWMGAYIAVMAHPFFAVTGTDGKFEIKNVPDGTYTLEIWQEKLGTKEVPVTVSGGTSAPVAVTLSEPAK